MNEVVAHQYIKILVVRLSVCVCVCDGCGRGRNEFAGCVTDVGVAVTNLRVVCKSITCVSAFHRNGPETEMVILNLS